MKNFKFGIIAVLLVTLVLVSCGTVSKSAACKHSDFVQIAPNATDGEEYLFTVDYSDYDYDKAIALFNQRQGKDVKAGACTAVRKGNFYGRNLDFYVHDEAQIALRMASKEGRYASIAMVTCMPLATKDAVLKNSLSEDIMNFLPLFTTDGINENGVVINVNVVPRGDFGHTTGTNPGASPVPQSAISRFVLDNAKSVDDAIEKLAKLNIYAVKDLPDYETHFMIADPTKTVIVEFGDNKMIVTEKNIMSNYYVSKPFTPYGAGYEREATVKKLYDSIKTQDDMYNAMKCIWYSNCYSTKTNPFWYSDMLANGGENTYDDIKAGRFEKFADVKKNLEKNYVSVDYQKQHRGADNTNWYTTHTTVYDIENRSFIICVQETDKLYRFSLKK